MISNTVWLKGDGMVKEGNAGAAITPGHLVQYNATLGFVVHNVAEGDAFAMFALEADFVGRAPTTAYATGERVQVLMPQRGAELNALVPANAAAIVVGDLLVSNGDGTLKKVTAAAVATTNLRRVVARALEALDNSAVGTPARLRIEII
jgi:hypothetical protein